MPRFTRLRAPGLEALTHDLRFSSHEALVRHVERAEQLATEINPDTSYPIDWVVFKLTSYRRETTGTSEMVPGRDLIADLPGIVERLSAAANFDAVELARQGAVDRAQLCDAWKVSPKTLARYKDEGLAGRRAIGVRGKPRVMFMPAMVAWFERRHEKLIDRAAGFSRLGPTLEAIMVRRAARYRARFDCSLNQTALRLSRRFGRSHEAVRQLLRRASRDHDDAPRFDDAARMTPRQRGVAFRAARRGIDPAEIAARWGRPRASIARAILLHRTELLWSLVDARSLIPLSEVFEDADNLQRMLAAAPACDALGTPGVTDLASFLSTARDRTVVIGVEELARSTAMRGLLHRAAVTILDIHRSVPTTAGVDACETMLRWATLLKIELMRSQLPMVIETLDGLVAGPLEDLPSGLTIASLKELLTVALAALAEAVDTFDPLKPGRIGAARLAAPAGLNVTRAATRWLKQRSPPTTPGTRIAKPRERAAGRVLPGIAIPDWTLSVSPWQASLWPDRRVRAYLTWLDAPSKAILTRRYGWDGKPPSTSAEIAAMLHTTIARATTLERRAVRAALAHARASTPSARLP